MINWREGKAGFVGGSKRLIKGIFRYAYSVTSAIAVPTAEGLEYTFSDNRLHYSTEDSKLHYEIPDNKLHYSESD